MTFLIRVSCGRAISFFIMVISLWRNQCTRPPQPSFQPLPGPRHLAVSSLSKSSGASVGLKNLLKAGWVLHVLETSSLGRKHLHRLPKVFGGFPAHGAATGVAFWLKKRWMNPHRQGCSSLKLVVCSNQELNLLKKLLNFCYLCTAWLV